MAVDRLVSNDPLTICLGMIRSSIGRNQQEWNQPALNNLSTKDCVHGPCWSSRIETFSGHWDFEHISWGLLMAHPSRGPGGYSPSIEAGPKTLWSSCRIFSQGAAAPYLSASAQRPRAVVPGLPVSRMRFLRSSPSNQNDHWEDGAPGRCLNNWHATTDGYIWLVV